MDCRITAAHKFRTRLVHKQLGVILTKEKSELTRMRSSFEGENMQTQYSVLVYRIDLYFHDYTLAIEIDEQEQDENGHSYRNIDYKIKRQKAIEQELGCMLLRVDPDKKDFSIFKAIDGIFRHIKQSSNQLTKKSLIDKISMSLLRLEVMSDNTIKLKTMKYIVNKTLPHYK